MSERAFSKREQLGMLLCLVFVAVISGFVCYNIGYGSGMRDADAELIMVLR